MDNNTSRQERLARYRADKRTRQRRKYLALIIIGAIGTPLAAVSLLLGLVYNSEDAISLGFRLLIISFTSLVTLLIGLYGWLWPDEAGAAPDMDEPFGF